MDRRIVFVWDVFQSAQFFGGRAEPPVDCRGDYAVGKGQAMVVGGRVGPGWFGQGNEFIGGRRTFAQRRRRVAASVAGLDPARTAGCVATGPVAGLYPAHRGADGGCRCPEFRLAFHGLCPQMDPGLDGI